MELKILLASSAHAWANETKINLASRYYLVSSALDGTEALAALAEQEYFALILDLDIKAWPGIEVMKLARKNSPSTHIILVVSEEESPAKKILNKTFLTKWGIEDCFFLPSPFEKFSRALENHHSYLQLINKRQVINEGDDGKNDLNSLKDKHFTSIRIDELYFDRPVAMEIYIKLADNKYVKLLRMGDALTSERLEKFKQEKKVKQLYFRTVDLPKYIKMQNFLSEEILKGKIVDDKKKLSVVKSLGEKIIENIYCEGIGPRILEEGKDFCSSVNEMISSHKNLSQLVRQLEEMDPTAYTKSTLVCFFSNMAIKQFSWTSHLTNQTLGMVSMLHDIGSLKLPRAINSLLPQKMTDEQLKIYKTHPQLSFNMLQSVEGISDSVRQIILQHHEYCDGTGFPHGLNKENMLSLSAIISMVIDYVDLMVDHKIFPPMAVKLMFSNKDTLKRYGLDNVGNFIKIFVDHKALAKGIKGANSD